MSGERLLAFTDLSRNLFERDLKQDALLAWLSERVFLVAEVALDEPLELFSGTLFSDLNDTTTNIRRMLRLSGIKHIDRYTRIALNVAHLLIALDGIDQNILTISIDPGLCQLWRTIGHESSNKSKNWFL